VKREGRGGEVQLEEGIGYLNAAVSSVPSTSSSHTAVVVDSEVVTDGARVSGRRARASACARSRNSHGLSSEIAAGHPIFTRPGVI